MEPKIINGGLAVDDRGCLRFINDLDFSKIKRFYQVENHQQNFVRAFHGHRQEEKVCYCSRGAALIITVKMDDNKLEEIRMMREIKTLNKIVLSASQPKCLVIPAGFYNGFKSLTNDTVLQFFSTSTLEESKNDDFRLPFDYYGDQWEAIPR